MRRGHLEQQNSYSYLELFYRSAGVGLVALALIFGQYVPSSSQEEIPDPVDVTAATSTTTDEVAIFGGTVVTQSSQVKVLSLELNWQASTTTSINSRATASGVDIPPLGGCDRVAVTAKHAIPGANQEITLTNALAVDAALPTQVITAPLVIYVAETSTLVPPQTDVVLTHATDCLPLGSVHQLVETILGFDGVMQGYGQYEPNKYDSKLRQLPIIRKLTSCFTVPGHDQACYKSKVPGGLGLWGDSGAPLLNAAGKTEAIYSSIGILSDGNGKPIDAAPYLLAERMTAGLIAWIYLCGDISNFGTEQYTRECEVHSVPFVYRPLDKHAYIPLVAEIDTASN